MSLVTFVLLMERGMVVAVGVFVCIEEGRTASSVPSFQLSLVIQPFRESAPQGR